MLDIYPNRVGSLNSNARTAALKGCAVLKTVLSYVSLCLGLVVCTQALAAEPAHYNRVNLSAQAGVEASNDVLVAVLYAQREGPDLPPLSDAVNKAISRAVTRAKGVSGVNVQTLDYRTHPITYRDKKVNVWRVRQSMRLESGDADSLGALVGELQETLAVESFSYKVSPAARAKAEEQAIGEAIAAFSERARQITRHLGHGNYRLVSMDVRTAGAPARPVPMRSSMAAAAVAAPRLEPGTQSVSVTASGVIELLSN